MACADESETRAAPSAGHVVGLDENEIVATALLRTFVGAGVMWQVLIHLTFVVSAIGVALCRQALRLRRAQARE